MRESGQVRLVAGGVNQHSVKHQMLLRIAGFRRGRLQIRQRLHPAALPQVMVRQAVAHFAAQAVKMGAALPEPSLKLEFEFGVPVRVGEVEKGFGQRFPSELPLNGIVAPRGARGGLGIAEGVASQGQLTGLVVAGERIGAERRPNLIECGREVAQRIGFVRPQPAG